MMNAVGGTSIHYWAQSWRLKPGISRRVRKRSERYGASRFPKGSTLEDWPVSYDDLEPYYDIVEHEVGVSGKAGNIQGKIDPARQCYEGPRQREYPMPPLRGTRLHRSHGEDRRGNSAGIRFTPPAAINSQPYRGRGRVRLSRLLRPRRLPRQRQEFHRVTTIPEAHKTKNLTIFDGRRSRASSPTPTAKSPASLTFATARNIFNPPKWCCWLPTPTRIRVCCCFRNPRRIRTVFRTITARWASTISAIGTSGGARLFPSTSTSGTELPAQGVAVDEWADDHFDHSGLGFIGGTSLHVRHGEASHRGRGHAHLRPRASVGFEMESSSCTRMPAASPPPICRPTASLTRTSYLDLDPEVKDPLGDPVCRITSGPKENEQRAALLRAEQNGRVVPRRGRDRGIEGPAVRARAFPPTPTAARAWATIPETNVVDRWGFLARSAESRHAGRVGDRHQRRAQSHADRAGAGVAHRRPPGEELEIDRRLSVSARSSPASSQSKPRSRRYFFRASFRGRCRAGRRLPV